MSGGGHPKRQFDNLVPVWRAASAIGPAGWYYYAPIDIGALVGRACLGPFESKGAVLRAIRDHLDDVGYGHV